jgi:hypothetical protein
MDKLADLLRQGADKLVNLPTEAQRFVTNPQAFIQLLTGKNALPRETGFAAGATGLPAQQGTVLDPNYQAYMQGYEQGEPFGYAAMATPAVVPVAKALAPKAGQMAENYMVNQGFMPSIVAYHGTPHTIKGKFDISKVGTGEGAQAYGHGMYFAEAKPVAMEYAKQNLKYPNTPLGDAQLFLRQNLFDYDAAKKDVLKNIDSLEKFQKGKFGYEESKAKYQETLNLLNKGNVPKLEGNLYKVDIPDEYIPNMLDFDKPLLQQPPNVLKALQSIDDPYIQKAITTQPKLSKDGEYWEYMGNTYASKAEALEDATPHRIISGYTGLGKTPQEVSQALGQYGIKGVKYLDQSSRIDGKGTSNFVVFDPAEVKILEQNSKPMTRKEILQQELKKVVE